MSVRTGPYKEIRASETPKTSTQACTAFTARGNAISLRVKTTTGGCGDITITAERAVDGSTYSTVLDRDSSWSYTFTEANTAGDYVVQLPLIVAPGESIRLSYVADTGAGTIQIWASSWDTAATYLAGDLGDLVADFASIKASLDIMDDREPATSSTVINPTNSSDRTAAALTSGSVYEFAATEDCWCCFCGSGGSAAAEADVFLPAGTPRRWKVPAATDNYFAAIRDTVDGYVSITELS